MDDVVSRRVDGTIIFRDHLEFRPNLTPKQMFEQGAFGGTYWRPIYSSVTGQNYRDQHKKYPFLSDLSENLLTRPVDDNSLNKYGVHSGTTLEYWESKNWIVAQDPYGWVQWYCEFFSGRRSDDDTRQIDRWLKFAGPKGRFLRRLVGLVDADTRKSKAVKVADVDISPVIRQGLHHWAKTLTVHDLKK